MRFNTIGSHWGTGSAAYGEGKTRESNTYHNTEKSGIIQQWIVKKRYKEIISTVDYALYGSLASELAEEGSGQKNGKQTYEAADKGY